MDFQLTDDQRAIADMAGSLFGDLYRRSPARL